MPFLVGYDSIRPLPLRLAIAVTSPWPLIDRRGVGQVAQILGRLLRVGSCVLNRHAHLVDERPGHTTPRLGRALRSSAFRGLLLQAPTPPSVIRRTVGIEPLPRLVRLGVRQRCKLAGSL